MQDAASQSKSKRLPKSKVPPQRRPRTAADRVEIMETIGHFADRDQMFSTLHPTVVENTIDLNADLVVRDSFEMEGFGEVKE